MRRPELQGEKVRKALPLRRAVIALNRRPDLKLHFRGARNKGVTGEEIFDLLLQPAPLDAMPNAREAILKMSENTANSKN